MANQEEKQIENQLVTYLSHKGHLAIPYENVGIYDPVTKGYRNRSKVGKIPGVSDILVMRGSDAVFGAIEVKRPEVKERIERNIGKWIERRNSGHKYSKEINHFLEQYDFIQQVKIKGGFGGFVSGVGDLINMGL